jgi:hypothetical protein
VHLTQQEAPEAAATEEPPAAAEAPA